MGIMAKHTESKWRERQGFPVVDEEPKSRHDVAVQQSGRGPEHMPIGEFGGAPPVPEHGGPMLATPMYWFYEMSHAALNPARAVADAARLYFKSPVNPWSYTTLGKSFAAAADRFGRSPRRYGQPDWAISSALVDGDQVPVGM